MRIAEKAQQLEERNLRAYGLKLDEFGNAVPIEERHAKKLKDCTNEQEGQNDEEEDMVYKQQNLKIKKIAE